VSAQKAGRRSLPFNAVSVLAGRLAVPALNLALVVSVARELGAAGLGRYTLLVTAYLILERLASLGLPTLVVREVSRSEHAAGAWYRGLVRIGLGGAAVTIVAAAAIASGSPTHELVAPAIVMAVGLVASAYALANDALFLAFRSAHLSTFVAAVENGARVGLSLLAVFLLHQGVLALAVVYVATRALGALLGNVLLRRHLGLTPARHDPALTRSMLRAAPEFLTIFALPILLFRLDVMMLALMTDEYTVGLYAVAARLISVCLIVPDSVMTAGFAFLSSASGSRGERELRELVARTTRWMVLLLVPLTLAVLLVGPVALRMLFGDEYLPSGDILRILAWSLLPFALNRLLGDTLVARGRQRAVAQMIVVTLVASVFFYTVLIAALGPHGAAWALVLTALFLFALTARLTALQLSVAQTEGAALALAPVAMAMTVFALGSGARAGLAWLIAILCVAAMGHAAVGELRLVRAHRSPEGN
jgi:O-antigen/teichoic acid export membrane protein